MAKEYIKRVDLKNRLHALCAAQRITAQDAIDISILPAADVVEVVRCGECKYRYDDDFCGGRGWPEQLVPDDGYCNNGAIKDGGV